MRDDRESGRVGRALPGLGLCLCVLLALAAGVHPGQAAEPTRVVVLAECDQTGLLGQDTVEELADQLQRLLEATGGLRLLPRAPIMDAVRDCQARGGMEADRRSCASSRVPCMLEASAEAGAARQVLVRIGERSGEVCELSLGLGLGLSQGGSYSRLTSEQVICARFDLRGALERLAPEVARACLGNPERSQSLRPVQQGLMLASEMEQDGRWPEAQTQLEAVWKQFPTHGLPGLRLAELRERCLDLPAAIEARRRLMVVGAQDTIFKEQQERLIAVLNQMVDATPLRRFEPARDGHSGWLRSALPVDMLAPSMALAADGSVLVAGRLARGGPRAGCLPIPSRLAFAGGEQMVVLKLGPDGELRWLASAVGTAAPNTRDSHRQRSEVTSVRALADGGALVAGSLEGKVVFSPAERWAAERTCDAAHGKYCSFVASYGASGELRWLRVLDGALRTRSGAFDAFPDGSSILVGNLVSLLRARPGGGAEISFSPTGEDSPLVALRLEADGALRWVIRLDVDPGWRSARDFQDGLAVEALREGAVAGLAMMRPTGPRSADNAVRLQLFRLDPQGRQTWLRTVDGTLTLRNRTSYLAGDSLMTGDLTAPLRLKDGFVLAPAGRSDAVLLRANAAGEVVWGRRMGSVVAVSGLSNGHGTGMLVAANPKGQAAWAGTVSGFVSRDTAEMLAQGLFFAPDGALVIERFSPGLAGTPSGTLLFEGQLAPKVHGLALNGQGRLALLGSNASFAPPARAVDGFQVLPGSRAPGTFVMVLDSLEGELAGSSR
jgi:hypothetical protein